MSAGYAGIRPGTAVAGKDVAVRQHRLIAHIVGQEAMLPNRSSCSEGGWPPCAAPVPENTVPRAFIAMGRSSKSARDRRRSLIRPPAMPRWVPLSFATDASGLGSLRDALAALLPP